jgi:cytidine deaminase
MTALSAKDLKKLAKHAALARGNAYCPYSNHPVGAAIVAGSGKVYLGANVETAHYKGVCAEASAISAMVSAGEREIRAVVVIGPAMEYLCTPCGDCRQRLREFSDEETRVYSLWKDGKLGAEHKMMDLLPLSFGPENLVEVGTLPDKKSKKKTAGAKNKKKTKPAAERVKKIIKKKDGDRKNDSSSRKLQPRSAR